MNIVNGYLSEAEKADYIALENAYINLDKACLAYDTFSNMRDLKIRDIELRCTCESATYDDLQAYFEAEAEKTNNDEKGLIRRIWDAIVSLFTSIKQVLFGKKKVDIDNAVNEHGDESVNVNSEGCGIIKKFTNLFDRTKKAVENKDIEEGTKIASEVTSDNEKLKKVGLVAVAGAATVAITVKELGNIYNLANTATNFLSGKAKEFSKTENDGKLKAFTKNVASNLFKIFSKFTNLICKAIRSVLSSEKLLEEAEKLDKKAEKNIENTQKNSKNLKDEINKLTDTLNEKKSQLKNSTDTKEKRNLQKEIDKLDKDLREKTMQLKNQNAKNGKKNAATINKANALRGEAENKALKEQDKMDKKEAQKNKKKNNKDNEEDNDDENTNESVLDILGFDIPDEIISEGAIEDDRNEILDLFESIL